MQYKQTALPDEPCHQLSIADSKVGQVTLCAGCGNIHLGLSNVALRFSPEAFRALAGLLETAQFRLDYIEQASQAAAAVIDAARHGPKLH